MQSTLTPKPNDDPHDIVVAAPDALRITPSDDALASLLREAARIHSGSQTRPAADVPGAATVPPVDTTFRSAAVDDRAIPGRRGQTGTRAIRAFIALLLAACIGVAAVAWRSYGDTAKKQIAKLTTQLAMTSSTQAEPSEQPAPPAAPAVAPAAASAALPQAPAPDQSVPAADAPSADLTQLQSVTRALANVTQEVEQLKASIEQLKASQQQISSDIARASEIRTSEQKLRPRTPAPAPRVAAAPVRRPVSASPPRQGATAPPFPQAAAPYPRQSDPPSAAGEELTDSELASVPRPPLPLR